MSNISPSFTGFHMTPKGKEKMVNAPLDFIRNELIPSAKRAMNDPVNELSIEDDGIIYITTPDWGKVTVNNPSNPKVLGRNLLLDVRSQSGQVKQIALPFDNGDQAVKFRYKYFVPGAYMPRLNLKLYEAVLAVDNYKKNLLNSLDAMSVAYHL